MYVTVLKRKHYPLVQQSYSYCTITEEFVGNLNQNVYVIQWFSMIVEPDYYVLHQVNQV